MSRRRRRRKDPAQFDLFQPPHEKCEDGRGAYLQFLIAPPTELGELAVSASVTTGASLPVLSGDGSLD